MKKLILLSILVFSFIIIAEKTFAQKKRTIYFYVCTTANDKGLKAIVTNVMSFSQDYDRAIYFEKGAICNQFHTYKEANITNWHKYGCTVYMSDKKNEMEVKRNQTIAKYRTEKYSLNKVIDFTYYPKE
jgi:hypothetical protein